MNISLSGKTALVCGSSKGIGKAVAMQLAEMGANVVLTARSLTDLTAVYNQLSNSGNQKHSYIVADFQEPERAVQAIKSQIPLTDPTDILVNNAGGPPPGKLFKAEIPEFREAFERHLHFSHLITQEMIQGMIDKGWGRIINIISVSVKQPIENLGVSNTLRAAMASWSKTLSQELGGYGITVNNILPGMTGTDRLYSLIENTARSKGITPMEAEQDMVKKIPLGRFADPKETAYLAGFLASDYAAYINGASIPVDGGMLRVI